MAETQNIGRMAELISDEIFEEFGWRKIGPTNVNWDCVDSRHDKVTHPSDVVFYYDEPYSELRTFVQTDLKSYAKNSISKSALIGAINSLAMQISCADKSEQWRAHYAPDHVPYQIAGMLFVYNHDGEFDREFGDYIEDIDLSSIDLPKKNKIAVISPENIFWLHNVGQEIARMRGRQKEGRLPDREYCSFFYPQPVRAFYVRSGEVTAASIEVLTGPRIILRYKKQVASGGVGYIVFHRGDGSTTEEFLYLLDYIRQHEMLHPESSIEIKAIDRDGTSQNNFQKSKLKYLEMIGGGASRDGIFQMVNSISFSSIKSVVPRFSETAIGMEYDR